MILLSQIANKNPFWYDFNSENKLIVRKTANDMAGNKRIRRKTTNKSENKNSEENKLETTASTSAPSFEAKVHIISFVCSTCLKKAIEVRMIPCRHLNCLDCIPKQCSAKCKKSLLDKVYDRPELYDKAASGYELQLHDLVKQEPIKKRQYPKQD